MQDLEQTNFSKNHRCVCIEITIGHQTLTDGESILSNRSFLLSSTMTDDEL